MTTEDFVLDNMVWSFSSTNSLKNEDSGSGCNYAFYLTYIKREKRINNFFSDFGLLIHDILEKYFGGELTIWDLEDYYIANYNTFVTNAPPPYPVGMGENYYQDGLAFFQNFEFEKDAYDVILIEDTVYANFKGVDLVVKPDLILKDKNGKYILYDFKTARLKKAGKQRNDQINNYMKQFLLYSYFLWTERDIEISEIIIWFIRDGVEVRREVNPKETIDVLEWFEETIKRAKLTEEWKPNRSKENLYFCSNICGVRESCKFQLGLEEVAP